MPRKITDDQILTALQIALDKKDYKGAAVSPYAVIAASCKTESPLDITPAVLLKRLKKLADEGKIFKGLDGFYTKPSHVSE